MFMYTLAILKPYELYVCVHVWVPVVGFELVC